MAFLRDYSHDLFVSYAHGPETEGSFTGQRDRLTAEWTGAFVDDLSAQIETILSQDDAFADGDKRHFSVFSDRDLSGSGSLTNNLKAAAQGSALLLVVMSPLYLRSKWCTDEIDWFLAAGAEESPELNRFSRIFVARAFDTDHTQWPGSLKDEVGKAILGHYFHSRSRRREDAFPYGWPKPDKIDQLYWTNIRRFAGDIAGKLLRLKQLERRSSSEVKVAAVEPAVGRRVFLGYVHDTLESVRSELRRELTKLGLQTIPPDTEEPWDEASLKEVLNTYLQQADAMALCANQYCGKWPRDQNGGFVSLQVQKANELNKPCQLWLAWDQKVEPQTPEYKSFLQDLIQKSKSSDPAIQINHANAREFARYVRDTVNDKVVAPTGVQQLAVVYSNLRPDEDSYRKFYKTVIAAINETDRFSVFPDRENPGGQVRLKALESVVNLADTIVVICFDQEWVWAKHIMAQIRQLIKAEAAKRVRLLIIGPPGTEGISADDASAFHFTTLDGNAMDEEHLTEVLKDAIAGGRKAAEDRAARTWN